MAQEPVDAVRHDALDVDLDAGASLQPGRLIGQRAGGGEGAAEPVLEIDKKPVHLGVREAGGIRGFLEGVRVAGGEEGAFGIGVAGAQLGIGGHGVARGIAVAVLETGAGRAEQGFAGIVVDAAHEEVRRLVLVRAIRGVVDDLVAVLGHELGLGQHGEVGLEPEQVPNAAYEKALFERETVIVADRAADDGCCGSAAAGREC